MKLSPVFRLLVLLFLIVATRLPAFAQTKPPDDRPRNASISGRVTVNGQPLANKTVQAREEQERSGRSGMLEFLGDASNSSRFHSAKTDGNGRYLLSGLPAGRYSLELKAPAFALAKDSPSRERQIALKEGEAITGIDFALAAGAVINGRVTDAEGHPVIDQRVEIRVSANQEEERNRHQERLSDLQESNTDDRGIYRIYGLPPGRYLVYVSGSNYRYSLMGNSGAKYTPTYHPGVTDEAQARVVEVGEGSEVANIDIRLGGAKNTYEVLGRVVDAENGQPVPQLSLISIGIQENRRTPGGSVGTATSDAKGNFRFAGLTSGKYYVTLSPANAFTGTQPPDHFLEDASFEVNDADLKDLEFRAKRGSTVTGRVVIETSPNQKKQFNPSQLALTSIVSPQSPLTPGSEEANIGLGAHNASMAKIMNDGSFRLSGLPAGKMMLRVGSLTGSGPKLIRIERDGVPIPEGIDIRAGENISGVKVVMALGTGVIRGQVNVTGGKLSEVVNIHITAERQGSSGPDSDEYSTADGNGRFVLDELLDGIYELSVTAVVDGSSPFSARQTVQIVNGAETTVNITLDLSRKKQQEERR